ncbi:MAG: UDP-N-acetylglucosamine--N-acetylmuramyl-(pentapeptide) pyrophosphoryl-undecaprenol N-acetylglucosamine transferase, partial [Myxococcota bacterium]
MSAHRYLLTGGGTGGHVYPAIAMADALREQEPEATFLYVGVRGKAEEKIVPARGYEIAYVESEGWPGSRPSLRLLRFGWTLVKGVWQALDILRKYRPDVIVATGGYVSAPIMLAWLILKRLRLTQAKTFVHEQNLVPGRLNRLIGNVADHVGVSFTESRRYLPRAEMLGYPVRREMVGKEQGSARAALKIPEDAKVILAFGGSQGARTINRAVVDALPRLLADEKVWVIHGVGRMNSKAYRALEDTQQRFFELGLPTEQKQRYKMLDYLDPIEDYYTAADLVSGRGGAGTLAEMALCGLSALLIPKANLPGDHQVRNARALQDKQAAALVYEHAQQTQEGLIEVVEGEVLAERVLALLDAPEQRASMREQ